MIKPNKEIFEEVLSKCGGNISKSAKALKCDRVTLHKWIREDPEFKQILDNSRGAFLDDCLLTGKILSLGIPEKDNEGKFIGWIERPDTGMLRYFISTLGRSEGYGENIDITTNGKDLGGIKVEIIDKRSDVIPLDKMDDEADSDD